MSSKKREASSGDALVRLTEALRAPAIGLARDTAVAVALSGGLDSTVLLHAVHRLASVASVRALHVDHGLRRESRDWAAQCRTAAAALGVELVERRLALVREPGQSLEDAARRARYAALAQMLEPGEVLLTAHHADDQLETLLYRILRGTGIRGLRGIAQRDVLGRGFVARPLLAVTRADIRATASLWGLRWIEDPSNEDARFDRNYLRAHVVPAVLARWPRASGAAQRLALAARDAEEIQDAMAERDLAAAGAADRLVLSALCALPPARRRNLVRHAARALALPVPDARQIARVLVLLDRPASPACVQWAGGEARTYRGHLFLMPPLTAKAALAEDTLRPDAAVALERGWLALERTDGAGLPEAWVAGGLRLTFRQGGERFWSIGGAHERALGRWFQEQAIVPWMRDRIPLIVHDGAIVAIADLALGDLAARGRDSSARWRIIWRDRPAVT